MTARILIVEDEPDLLAGLEYNLRKEGYDTCTAETGAAALDLVRTEPYPDLVLLDLMLPDISGKEVCRKIKAAPNTQHIPVIMVTARTDEVDRIIGFEIGAEDYVSKPFSVRELILRVQAVLRRSQQSVAKEAANTTLEFGCLEIDLDGHNVLVDGSPIVLTALEFRLLRTLLERKGRVQSRTTLLETVWGMDGDINTRTVDTHVKRLRKKLGLAGDYLQTVRGVGYRFRRDPGDPTA